MNAKHKRPQSRANLSASPPVHQRAPIPKSIQWMRSCYPLYGLFGMVTLLLGMWLYPTDWRSTGIHFLLYGTVFIVSSGLLRRYCQRYQLSHDLPLLAWVVAGCLLAPSLLAGFCLFTMLSGISYGDFLWGWVDFWLFLNGLLVLTLLSYGVCIALLWWRSTR